MFLIFFLHFNNPSLLLEEKFEKYNSIMYFLTYFIQIDYWKYSDDGNIRNAFKGWLGITYETEHSDLAFLCLHIYFFWRFQYK